MSSKLERTFRIGSEKNGASSWYTEHYVELHDLMDRKYYTLPIAAAYNAGYDEAMKKVRNIECHILQMKNG